MEQDFETTVSAIVNDITDDHQWFNGTLFVPCGENAARHIWHVLCDTFGIAHVRVSKAGAEYAYDFV